MFLFLSDFVLFTCDVASGIAGASYIPTVQAALPRLLGAAAPPGASARENRRQCLKVIVCFFLADFYKLGHDFFFLNRH